jgi:hypothetical protein
MFKPNAMRLVLLTLTWCVIPVHAGEKPTLEQITAEQDWIARSPTNPRWLVDGRSIRYSQRRVGEAARGFSDSFLIHLDDLSTEHVMIKPENPGPYFVDSGDWNSDATRSILTESGDLYIYDSLDHVVTQLTRSFLRMMIGMGFIVMGVG